MSTFEIPLQPTPQRFAISLAGVTYEITVTWNAATACWIMDVADQNSVPIVGGIPLLTGSDLLEQFQYLGLGGAMYSQTDTDPWQVPTFDDLGSTGHLYFVTP